MKTEVRIYGGSIQLVTFYSTKCIRNGIPISHLLSWVLSCYFHTLEQIKIDLLIWFMMFEIMNFTSNLCILDENARIAIELNWRRLCISFACAEGMIYHSVEIFKKKRNKIYSTSSYSSISKNHFLCVFMLLYVMFRGMFVFSLRDGWIDGFREADLVVELTV